MTRQTGRQPPPRPCSERLRDLAFLVDRLGYRGTPEDWIVIMLTIAAELLHLAREVERITA